MDPAFFYQVQRGLYLLPIIVSLSTLVGLWWEEKLYGGVGTLFCVWFVIAAVTQLFARSTGVWWAVGLVAQVALAIVLVLKKRIDDVW
jgi:hypothetical protein